MKKGNKLVQLFVIGLTAYNLYRVVSQFLETETGQAVKEKAVDYYETAKDKVSDMMSNTPAVEEVLENVTEETIV